MKKYIIPIITGLSVFVITMGAVLIYSNNSGTNNLISNVSQSDVSESVNDDHTHEHSEDEDHDHESNSLGEGYDFDLLSAYTISDNGYGTEVIVTLDSQEGTRTIETNALPNHETGEFPNAGNPNEISEQDQTWIFPSEGNYTGQMQRETVTAVGINGIKFQPATNERATCENGITYNIEAVNLSDLHDGVDVGLDFNNAHVQPTGEYHYHGVSELLVDSNNQGDDLVHVGFAADGHLLYHSKSNAYTTSYQLGTEDREGINCVHIRANGEASGLSFDATKDGSLAQDWEFDQSYGDLDECNGIEIDGEYIYLITDQYPFVPRCVMGETINNGQVNGAQQRARP